MQERRKREHQRLLDLWSRLLPDLGSGPRARALLLLLSPSSLQATVYAGWHQRQHHLAAALRLAAQRLTPDLSPHYDYF